MEAEDYRRQVFINCPFDSAYRKLFYAIVFAVQDCGYIARSALEVSDAGETRLAKILQLISECGVGIHDISRTEINRQTRLPRFNMPLELGMFLGAKQYGDAQQRSKVSLVLDRSLHRYEKFCSDIKGCDISSHRRDPALAISAVRDFLRNAPPRMQIPGGKVIYRRYREFLRTLPVLCKKAELPIGNLIFSDYSGLVAEWLKEKAGSA